MPDWLINFQFASGGRIYYLIERNKAQYSMKLDGVILILALYTLSKGQQTPMPRYQLQSGGNMEETFSTDFRPIYYVSPKKPALLECSARFASEMRLGCQSPTNSTCWKEGVISICEIHVYFIDVFLFFEDFYCECSFRAKNGVFYQQKARVVPSYINDEIKIEKLGFNITGGTKLVKLVCHPPNGDPKPEISWKENGRKITKLDKIIEISNKSILVYVNSKSSAVNYSCMATNIAGTVESTDIYILPPNREKESINLTNNIDGFYIGMTCSLLGFGMSLCIYLAVKYWSLRNGSLNKCQSGTFYDSNSWDYYPSRTLNSQCNIDRPLLDKIQSHPYVVDSTSLYLSTNGTRYPKIVLYDCHKTNK